MIYPSVVLLDQTRLHPPPRRVHCQFVCCHMRVLQGCFIIIFIVVVVVDLEERGKKNELQSFLGLIEGCDI